MCDGCIYVYQRRRSREGGTVPPPPTLSSSPKVPLLKQEKCPFNFVRIKCPFLLGKVPPLTLTRTPINFSFDKFTFYFAISVHFPFS